MLLTQLDIRRAYKEKLLLGSLFCFIAFLHSFISYHTNV